MPVRASWITKNANARAPYTHAYVWLADLPYSSSLLYHSYLSDAHPRTQKSLIWRELCDVRPSRKAVSSFQTVPACKHGRECREPGVKPDGEATRSEEPDASRYAHVMHVGASDNEFQFRVHARAKGANEQMSTLLESDPAPCLAAHVCSRSNNRICMEETHRDVLARRRAHGERGYCLGIHLQQDMQRRQHYKQQCALGT